MWEAIKEVLTNSFGLVALIIIAVFIIVLLVLSKKGFFTINTKVVKIGQDIKTRNLIQRQLEYIHNKITSLIPELKNYSSNEYKLKYILADVEDCFQLAAVFNNMSKTRAYIEGKQIAVYSTVIKNISKEDNPYFFSNEFKEYIYEKTKEIIEALVDIKEEK